MRRIIGVATVRLVNVRVIRTSSMTNRRFSTTSRSSTSDGAPDWNDQAHFCTWLVNPAMVDFIFDHFKDCVVLGKPSSVPYLSQQAERRGVRLRFRPDVIVPDDCECAIFAGAWGEPQTDKPVFQLMGAGWGHGPVVNVSPEMAQACPPARLPPSA